MGLLGALPADPRSSTTLPAEVAPFPEAADLSGSYGVAPPSGLAGCRVPAPSGPVARAPRWRRAVRLAALFLRCSCSWRGGLVHHVYFDRSGLPDLESFLRFEPPTIGEVRDAGQGPDRARAGVPPGGRVRRGARHPARRHPGGRGQEILSHSGVEYRALPRVVQKTAVHSRPHGGGGDGFRPVFPQGGSTLTQQLVRGYFLADLTIRENGDALFRDPDRRARVLSAVLGVRATNKLLRKMEEVRLSLWLEDEMRGATGRAAGQARDLRPLRQLHLPRQRPLRLRRRLRVLLRQAPVELHAGGRGKGGTAGGDQQVARGTTPRCPATRGPCAAETPSWPSWRATDTSPRPREALPGRADPRGDRNPVKTDAPAAIANVLEELKQRGGTRFGIEDLFQGRISVHSTVDDRVQTIVNEALEKGLALYEKRHRRAKGLIQGSVVVLRNADAAILAEAGGRQVYQARSTATPTSTASRARSGSRAP